MPLLHLEHRITLGIIAKEFKHETGLTIQFSMDGETPDGALTLREIWREKYERKYDSAIYYHRMHERLPSTMFRFDYHDNLAGILEELEFYTGMSVSITSDCLPDDCGAMLKDFPPKKFKIPKDDIAKQRKINRRLEKIVKDLHSQRDEITNRLNPRLKDRSDWLMDYEFDCTIQYYLDEKDPLYREDSDNIIAEQKVCLSKKKWNEIFDDGENYNDREPPGQRREKHCYLFHDLYDHNSVQMTDIQRIGKIWIDLNVIHQHFYRR